MCLIYFKIIKCVRKLSHLAQSNLLYRGPDDFHAIHMISSIGNVSYRIPSSRENIVTRNLMQLPLNCVCVHFVNSGITHNKNSI